MASTATRRRSSGGGRRSTVERGRWRVALLWLAGLRAVVSIAAIPLAPVLWKRHFLVLVLLRPTKDVLLASGFALRAGRLNLFELLLAAVPLLLFGVWQFFFLGRAYRQEIEDGEVPGIGKKLLPADKIGKLRDVLEKKGARLVFLGRLAAFPSSLVGAAAGTSDLEARRFLVADGLGALASFVEIVGAGFLLGEAYKSAGPWLTVAGIAVLVAGAVLLGRSLRRDT